MVPNKWDNSRLDLHILIGDLVRPLHKNHFFFSKSFIDSLLVLLHPWKENSIRLTYDTPKNFPKIVWFCRHLEYELKTLFEAKNNSEMEDINESFRVLFSPNYRNPKCSYKNKLLNNFVSLIWYFFFLNSILP